MAKPQPKQKIYCYVDETGQDTEGQLFLVAVVMTGEERDELRRYLASIEEHSGKRIKKWSRSTPQQREAYIRGILNCPALEKSLYYSRYEGSRAYVDLTVLSVAKAINTHTTESYAATILVDGLRHRTEQHRFAHGLRALRIKARKVRGLTDESDAFIRLADALAGFVRDSLTGTERFAALYKEGIKKGVLREV
jgi:hypothetical protein